MYVSVILDAIDEQISLLQQARRLIDDSAPVPAFGKGRPPLAGKAAGAKQAGKATLSEEGRARIAAAQKTRWAAVRTSARAV